MRWDQLVDPADVRSTWTSFTFGEANRLAMSHGVVVDGRIAHGELRLEWDSPHGTITAVKVSRDGDALIADGCAQDLFAEMMTEWYLHARDLVPGVIN